MSEPITLEEVIDIVSRSWPDRYSRGRVMHVHRNAIKVQGGALVHLRLLIQTIAEADPVYHPEDKQEDNRPNGKTTI